MSFNYLFSEMNYFLARLDEQFRVADHFFPVNSVHSVSGSNMRIHHPVVDGVVLLLRRHFIPRRAVPGFDSLPLLHYLLRHRTEGREIFKLHLLHPLSADPRHGCCGGHLRLLPAVLVVVVERRKCVGSGREHWPIGVHVIMPPSCGFPECGAGFLYFSLKKTQTPHTRTRWIIVIIWHIMGFIIAKKATKVTR